MPSISDLVRQNQERIARGGDLVQPVEGPTGNAAIQMPSPPPPPVGGLPVRGYYPQGSSLDGDFAGTAQITRTGVGMRSPTFPNSKQSIVTTIKAAATAIASTATSFIWKVNNLVSPVTAFMNIVQGTGMQIVMDTQGNVTFTSTSSGDGLTHGDPIWDVDGAVNWWRDDFQWGLHKPTTLPDKEQPAN